MFDFYSDPGHGWLKVPRRLLDELEIADRISRFSYERGQYVYLEQDKDTGTFMTNWQNRTGKMLWEHVREHTAREHQSKIRGYESYAYHGPAERARLEKIRAAMLRCKPWNYKALRTIRAAGPTLLTQWAGQFNLTPE